MRAPMKQQPHTFRMHSRYVRHARRDALRHGTTYRPVAPSARARIERVRRENIVRMNEARVNVRVNVPVNVK
jgi:hypothetical protein